MAKKFGNGIDLQNQRGQNFATPSVSTDAVNKAYVDGLVAGLRWKPSVRVASTTNVSLASPGSTIDGVTLATNDRVLLKDQSAGAENGVYVWTGASSALTRASDGTTGTLAPNSTWFVEQGTVNADTAWTVTTDGPITVGTTAITLVRFGAGGSSYAEGNGIDISGSVISAVAGTGIVVSSSGIAIDVAIVTRKYAANIGNGSSTSIAITHNLGTKDITWSVRYNSNDEFFDTDGVATDNNTLTLTFATAPANNQFRVVVHG